MTNIKIDLHTHSILSHDGGISAQQYKEALKNGLLDCVAITDHNEISFALQLHKELGNKVIVGEEIMTTEGEIIGLFLTTHIAPGLTPKETIKHIRKQNGLVYIPHPFETVRKGLPATVLADITDDIDIVETFNGRAFWQKKHRQANEFSLDNDITPAASSDAHGPKALGHTYSHIDELPAKNTLVSLLQEGSIVTIAPTARALLYPKFNKILKKIINK